MKSKLLIYVTDSFKTSYDHLKHQYFAEFDDGSPFFAPHPSTPKGFASEEDARSVIRTICENFPNYAKALVFEIKRVYYL